MECSKRECCVCICTCMHMSTHKVLKQITLCKDGKLFSPLAGNVGLPGLADIWEVKWQTPKLLKKLVAKQHQHPRNWLWSSFAPQRSFSNSANTGCSSHPGQVGMTHVACAWNCRLSISIHYLPSVPRLC